MTPGWWFYLKQLLMYISKGIDGKFELSTHLCCLSTRKNESECQKKKIIHYSVGQISADDTSDELTFLNDSFDKTATCFSGLYIIGRSSNEHVPVTVSVLTQNQMFAKRFTRRSVFVWEGCRTPHLCGQLVYQHEHRKVKHSPRCHFVLCSDRIDPKLMIPKCAKRCK